MTCSNVEMFLIFLVLKYTFKCSYPTKTQNCLTFLCHNFRLKHDLLLPDKVSGQSQKLEEKLENVETMQHFTVVQESLLEVTKQQNDSTSSNKAVFHQVKILFTPQTRL